MTASNASNPTDPWAHRHLLSVGHGVLSASAFGDLLTDAGVSCIADVRAHPGSRRSPHFARDQLAHWLPERGIRYSWLPRLGGRRRGRPTSLHTALRNDGFRAYADHMDSHEFQEGVDELVELADHARVAVMCSETLWWRCHRRLLSDHLELVRHVDVEHLWPDGRRTEHQVTPGARVDDGQIVYDVAAPASSA